ncbi:MFS transporter [Haloarcula marina]|uniref:MFS transporter n=1 Tax=Haloarcula marina TaxID=2961574 RepID=UPI0020B769AC|nr:MFS transporter [Halomicroarcula marina]
MASDRWLYAWALGSVALGAASLLVPLYFVTIGGSTLLLGVLAGVAAAAGAPGALIFGRIADKTGKRRSLVLAALAIAAGALVVVALSESELVVILGNGVLWFSAGAVAPVLTLLVTVGALERDWPGRFATLNRYQGWGWAGGLVLGLGWTALLSGPLGTQTAQRSLLLVCAAVAFVSATLVTRWLPSDAKAVEKPRPSRIARALARSRRLPVRSATFPVGPGRLYWLTRSFHPRQVFARLTPSLSLYFLAIVAVFVGFGVFWGPLPSYLSGTLSYDSGTIFALYLVSSLGSALCYGAAGRLVERYDAAGVQTGGLLARAVLHPAVALVVGVVPAATVALVTNAAVFLLIGVAWALIAVTAASIVTQFAPSAIRGEALGLYTALSGLASGVGSVLGGWLGGYGFTLAFGVAGGFVFVGTVVVAVLWWRAPQQASDALTTAD